MSDWVDDNNVKLVEKLQLPTIISAVENILMLENSNFIARRKKSNIFMQQGKYSLNKRILPATLH